MREKGVSLVEILLVVTMVGFLVFLIGNLPSSINLIGKAKNLSLAREIAASEVEEKRAVGFINLAHGETQITDGRINLLSAGSGTVEVADCDPQVCTQSENAKEITVKVNWRQDGKNQEVILKTLIAEGGL